MINFLITGAEQKDRLSYALKIAKKYLCLNDNCDQCHHCHRINSYNHPNLIVISPLKDMAEDQLGTIKIEQIRGIIAEYHKASFEKGPRFFIITHMHMVTIAAQNALLKTIEESDHNNIFMALAVSRYCVLATIASRLKHIVIKPKRLSESIYEQNIFDQIMSITSSPQSLRLEFSSCFGVDREDVLEELYRLSYNTHIMVRNNVIDNNLALRILESINKACNDIEKNHNTKLVIEQMLLCDWPSRAII